MAKKVTASDLMQVTKDVVYWQSRCARAEAELADWKSQAIELRKQLERIKNVDLHWCKFSKEK